MANKQYISIIRLFHHFDIETGAGFNLSRAKKQLQAEFNISEKGFIEIDGYTYTRHDVFEEIDQPDFLKRLVFHQQIWQSPKILQLLENNTAIPSELDVEFIQFWSNTEFDHFFSPYFAGPFSYLSRTFLTNYSFADLHDLLRYEDFLKADEREEAFKPIRIFLDENIRILRNVNAENYSLMRPKIILFIDKDWHLFFNNLPHEFYEAKNDIAGMLINIGVAIQKTHRRDCRKMSEKLIQLEEMPANISEIIVSNHSAYQQPARRFNFSLRPGWALIWVLFMLIKCVASDGCKNDNNTFNYDRIIYKPPKTDSSLLKFLKEHNINLDSLK